MKKRVPASLGMSILSLLCCLFLLPGSLTAQKLGSSEVPAAVINAFSSSEAGEAEWHLGPGNSYEAHIQSSGAQQVHVYNGAGTLQQKKYEATSAQLPISIRNSVGKLYPGQVMAASYRVMSRDKRRFYEVRMLREGKLDILRYSQSGKPINRTSMAVVTEKPEAAAPENLIGMRGEQETAVEAADPAASTPVVLEAEQPAPVVVEVDIDPALDDDLIDDDIRDLLEEDDDQDIEDLLSDDDDGEWESLENSLWEEELEDDLGDEELSEEEIVEDPDDEDPDKG